MTAKKMLSVTVMGMVLMGASVTAQAQTAAQQAAGPLRGLAAASFQAPVGFGAGWGSVGFGVYGQTLGDYSRRDFDGSAGIAVGLGDPDKYFGLEVAAIASSLTKQGGDNFGEAGALAFKLHTNLPGNASVAVGVNGTNRWGTTDRRDNQSSAYLVGTKFFKLGDTLGLVGNLGVGDGIYRGIDGSGAGVIGSLALYLSPRFSIIGEYTGRFANAAISAAPFRSLPLTVTVGAVNLGERYNDDVQFAGSLGIGFGF